MMVVMVVLASAVTAFVLGATIGYFHGHDAGYDDATFDMEDELRRTRLGKGEAND